MKKINLFLIGFLISVHTFSQIYQQEVIASTGDYYTGQEIKMSMTFGETFTETLSGANYISTQGFQQPLNIPFLLDIKAYLEGPWFGGQMTPFLNVFGYLPLSQPYHNEPWNYLGTEYVSSIPNTEVIDWVLVELRETTGNASNATSNTVIGKKAAFVLKNGSVVAKDGFSKLLFDKHIQDNLYVVLWQRNHLGIISNYPLSENNKVYSYNFSSSANQALGGTLAQKQVSPGTWAMISGDGNADGQVNNSDKSQVWKVQSGLSGYLMGDFNMNGQVDNTDKNLFWKPNTGRGTQVPD